MSDLLQLCTSHYTNDIKMKWSIFRGSGAIIHISRDNLRKFHVHCEEKGAAWLPGPWWKDLPGSRYRQIAAQCEQALANVQKGLSNKRNGLPQKSWFLLVELLKPVRWHCLVVWRCSVDTAFCKLDLLCTCPRGHCFQKEMCPKLQPIHAQCLGHGTLICRNELPKLCFLLWGKWMNKCF